MTVIADFRPEVANA